jgi:hypothetical protein
MKNLTTNTINYGAFNVIEKSITVIAPSGNEITLRCEIQKGVAFGKKYSKITWTIKKTNGVGIGNLSKKSVRSFLLNF